jgi:L-threonylcarbamoyladenylate synthase
METKILRIDPSDPDLEAFIANPSTSHTSSSLQNILTAASALRTGSIPVAFPTETVYGLAGDATRDAPVSNIFAVKGRPADNPLIIHFASVAMLREFIRPANNDSDDPIPEIYKSLLDNTAFVPGPLSILLPVPKESKLSRLVLGSQQLKTFAARIPSSTIARALIAGAGVPIAAPSANVSGRPSPTEAKHVYCDFKGKIEYIVDGGPCDVGLESTVVDGLDEGGPVVLRPGGVGVDELRKMPGWERVRISGHSNGDSNGVEAPKLNGNGETNGYHESDVAKAPGMKYRHYAPRCPVTLLPRGSTIDLEEPGKWGIISTGSLITTFGKNVGIKPEIWNLGSDPKDVAHGMFSALREMDEMGVKGIYIEEVDEKNGDIAVAVMNRLRKAAEG